MDQYEVLAKKDNAIMFTLKLNHVAHVLAQTDKGTLMLKLVKGGTGKDYQFVLDAVPFSIKENAILLDLWQGMLFDIK